MSERRDSERLEAFVEWFRQWYHVANDLEALGVEVETVKRYRRLIIDLSNIVRTISRANGAPREQPPAA